MNEIALKSFGKINLALDVLYKRDDGYHEINTLMQQIDLGDNIILRNREKGIEIECNDKDVPLDSTNLAYRAWEKIIERTGINKGIHIIIDKNIPVAAGLAGGSSNGATVLKGLNQLWELNLSEKELMEIGLEIGADIPFCIMGGTAWGKGVGEKLTRLKSFSNKMILLANVGIPISTAHVYNRLNLNSVNTRIDIEGIVKHMEEDNLPKLAENMANIMEGVVIEKYPIVGKLKREMINWGALGSIMSGSGPTVFGLFDDEEKLIRCKHELEKKIDKVYITRTL